MQRIIGHCEHLDVLGEVFRMFAALRGEVESPQLPLHGEDK